MTEVDEHDCPYCGGIIDLGDWSPYTSEVREVTCPTCDRVADIEWDDQNGWVAWLSRLSESAPHGIISGSKDEAAYWEKVASDEDARIFAMLDMIIEEKETK